jgi:hypothetical protein
MLGFNRFEALKKAIRDGKIDFAMMLADFHLASGGISQGEFDELVGLAYPSVVEMEVVEEVVEG